MFQISNIFVLNLTFLFAAAGGCEREAAEVEAGGHVRPRAGTGESRHPGHSGSGRGGLRQHGLQESRAFVTAQTKVGIQQTCK